MSNKHPTDSVVDIQRRQNLETRIHELNVRERDARTLKLLETLSYLVNHATFGGWLIDDVETMLQEFKEMDV